MKKLSVLLIFSLIIGNSEAQTVSKNGTTATHHKTSTSGGSSHVSSTPRTSSTTHKTSSSTSSKVEKQHQFENNEPGNTSVRYKTGTISFRKKIAEKEANQLNAAENTEVNTEDSKGKIKTVNRAPEITNYEDRNKVEPVSNTNNTATNSNGTTTDSSANTAPKYIPSNNSGINITCGEYENFSFNKRREILLNHNKYNFTEVNSCRSSLVFNQNFDDRLVITCEEFTNFSDDKKQHIINFPNFYNTNDLKDCEAYLEFLKK